MMEFNALDARTLREQIEMGQIWSAWIDAEDQKRHSFRGSLRWEQRSGRDYLYSRKRAVVKSLGPRSEATEQIFAAFHVGKAANAARLSSLATEMEQQAAILRALGAGRLPVMAARTLRSLRLQGRHAAVRVIGTTALYAYEALAGLRFNAASTATGDIDILVDDRNKLRLLAEDDQEIGLIRLIQDSVDKTFLPRGARDFRLTNDRGYMIEFVRPEPKPVFRKMPGADPLVAGDVEPAPVIGLQWLVHAPAVEVVVLDERGFPAPMRCPDPRHWMAHKLWLAGREDRDPAKKLRDREQAAVMLRVLRQHLPQFPLDAAFLRGLPGDLRRALAADDPPARSAPQW
ncbi:nucleotidyltransferase domain-containing protein [Gemmobacter fulvus]|uniref:nucleotidyltransferase domain-containing protein n=1 Tax=Gemmobacter fulvus TaxID=2840474 RepID=UPI002796400E|nr:nucleotidyltransferase domain-containing protein [Gemmobacter fulvus]MDQ1850258.1 nucleotidyltransferase domain-containing protein [Gemmobacter fulvus]